MLKENNKNCYAIEAHNVGHNVTSIKSGVGASLFARNMIDYHVRYYCQNISLESLFIKNW